MNNESAFHHAVALRLVQMKEEVADNGMSSRPQADSCFWTSVPPKISLEDYVARIASGISDASEFLLICALVLIERYVATVQPIPKHLSMHRLLITAILIASKTQLDTFYTNEFYAALGGITAAEMSVHELEFAAQLNWILFISAADIRRAMERIDTLICRNLN